MTSLNSLLRDDIVPYPSRLREACARNGHKQIPKLNFRAARRRLEFAGHVTVGTGVRTSQEESDMSGSRLRDFLDKEKVKYVTITHSPAFTAQEIAESSHVPGKELAKTVIVKIDGRLAMVVTPATEHVKLHVLEATLGATEVALASESDFENSFPDCETGAMPPFGNLYDMPVFVSQSLREDDHIAFNAGSHSELVRLPYAEFERLVEPTPLAA